ncbi:MULTISPECIES: NAD-dependent epimerase/dehydratase family protein [unclassified Sphingobacterium]|uniref:NAD-dependent epimerase/dehydratase family protein n=2 Tax=Sphingobacterium TaxID=28453 RepID=UPI0025D4EF6B|nr:MULTISPECIES: NAD-dependent epimerase/dehydratase family protein [unclassified Sphingobacterium]
MIAVFGGSGFIGKHLLDSLRNCSEHSLRDIDWREKLQLSNPEIIINLVGKAHDHSGNACENDFYFANFELVKYLFDGFKNSKAGLFIHISSLAAVEEFQSDSPLREDSVCNPISWYGKSKRAAEEWLMEQKLPFDKKLIILRPPMVHGVGDKGNLGLLYKFIAKGIPYPLSAFDNKRSFISTGNLSFFIKQIIENQHLISTGIYNVADDEYVSTKQLIYLMKKVTGKRTLTIALPKVLIRSLGKVGDILGSPFNTKRIKKLTSNLLVSNEKLKSVLNIEKLPFTAEEGLEITIESFSKSYNK